MDPRCKFGVVWGRSWNGDQQFIWLSDGSVARAKGIARPVPAKRWQARRLELLRATPWNEQTRTQNSIEPSQTPHAIDKPQLQHEQTGEQDGKPSRRFPILGADLGRLGYTPHCPKSNLCAIEEQELANKSRHSDACVQRMHDLLRQEGSKKSARGDEQGKAAPPPSTQPMPSTQPTTTNNIDEQALGSLEANANDTMPIVEPPAAVVVDAILGNEDFITHADVLQTLGVDPVVACRYACSIISKNHSTYFVEMYGADRLVQAATARRQALNVVGLGALDLRTLRRDGRPRDFRNPKHRAEAEKIVDEEQQDWVVGSPPCVAFCPLNRSFNVRRTDPDAVKHLLHDGLLHLNFMFEIYLKQSKAGRYFLHEHPAGAASWRERERESSMQILIDLPNVHTTISHQCEFGLLTPAADGTMQQAMKPTRWASNSAWMIQRLDRRC